MARPRAAQPASEAKREPAKPGARTSVPGGLPAIHEGPSRSTSKRQSPAPPYVLVLIPGRWTVLGGRVVPQLHEQSLIHGDQGVIVRRDPETGAESYDLGGLRANLANKGATILPYDIGGLPYLRELPEGSGRWYSAHAHVSGRGAIRPDEEAHSVWLAGLMEAGALPTPEPHELADLADRLRGYMDAYEQAGDRHRKRMIADQLAVVEQAMGGADA